MAQKGEGGSVDRSRTSSREWAQSEPRISHNNGGRGQAEQFVLSSSLRRQRLGVVDEGRAGPEGASQGGRSGRDRSRRRSSTREEGASVREATVRKRRWEDGSRDEERGKMEVEGVRRDRPPTAHEHCLACGGGPYTDEQLPFRCSCGGPVCRSCEGANYCLRCSDATKSDALRLLQ